MLTNSLATLPVKLRAMQPSQPKGNLQQPFWLLGRWQTSKLLYFLPLCFLLFAVGLVGCGNSAPLGMGKLNFINPGVNVTKIGDIQHRQNSGTTVYLQGQVATRAPFLGSGAYKLEDASGTIWILTNQPMPNVGDELLIKGQLQFQSIPVSGQELGEVYVLEEQQLQRQPKQSQPVSPNGQ